MDLSVAAVVWDEDDSAIMADNDELIVWLINDAVINAFKGGFSDIDIEYLPDRQCTTIEFRMDRRSVTHRMVPLHISKNVLSRLRVMARLQPGPYHKPRVGRIRFGEYAPLDIEVAVAFMPTNRGIEKAQIHL